MTAPPRASAPRSNVPGPPETVDRCDTALGEWVLRRRVDPDGRLVFEIVANGAFLMDSREHGTEERLAEVALGGLPRSGGLSVLVGGLGFGYTLRAVLEDDRLERVTVVELAPAVVDWMRGPVAYLSGAPLDDPRVDVVVGDVGAFLGADRQQPWDAVVLDVDNGPEFLVHEHNAPLYSAAGLRRCREVLRPGGRMALWSSERSPRCLADLARVFDGATEHVFPVEREGRRFDYYVYAATR
ncbi:MAG: hypothetical protein ACOCV4_03550 [Myxococcota bacterium]